MYSLGDYRIQILQAYQFVTIVHCQVTSDIPAPDFYPIKFISLKYDETNSYYFDSNVIILNLSEKKHIDHSSSGKIKNRDKIHL